MMGTDNTAIGFEALFKDMSGDSNTALGLNALHENTTGNSNTANGLPDPTVRLAKFNFTGEKIRCISRCRFPLSGFFEQGAFVMLPRGCLPESLAEEGQSMPEALVTATIFLRPFYAPFKPSSP
jgi:hypothetical protein